MWLPKTANSVRRVGDPSFKEEKGGVSTQMLTLKSGYFRRMAVVSPEFVLSRPSWFMSAQRPKNKVQGRFLSQASVLGYLSFLAGEWK